ncbi:Rgg family transcriptional regulator [Vagococcus sp. JNUCC 83]
MKNDYGKVVRNIRLNKGYSQKYLYSGIVSKTYAIDFEKGLHDMSVTKFMEVLDRLDMKFEEFEFIVNDYKSSEEITSNVLIAIATNRGDIETLRKLRAYYDEPTNKQDEILKARLNLLIFNYKESLKIHNESLTYPSEDVEVLKDYLMSVESWTLKEFAFFLNNGHYFDYDTYRFLTEFALKQLMKYNSYSDAIKVKSYLFVNYLSTALENKDWERMNHYRQDFFEVTKNTEEGFQRILCVLTFNLYDYVMTHDNQFLENAKKIEEMCYLLGGDYNYLAKGMTNTIQFCEKVVSGDNSVSFKS